MINSRLAIKPIIRIIAIAIIFTLPTVTHVFAQSDQTNINQRQSGVNTQSLTTQSAPAIPPDVQRPPYSIQRVGTAIGTPRSSISIKSTDAGIIHRQPPASGCINCGVVDFVNRIGQGPGLNAIAGGIVAGTVAREIIRQDQHHSGATNHHDGRHLINPSDQYQVGITLHDGSQAIIALPDATNFHQGDRVKLIDGKLVPDY